MSGTVRVCPEHQEASTRHRSASGARRAGLAFLAPLLAVAASFVLGAAVCTGAQRRTPAAADRDFVGIAAPC